jgi:hypothetical protein
LVEAVGEEEDVVDGDVGVVVPVGLCDEGIRYVLAEIVAVTFGKPLEDAARLIDCSASRRPLTDTVLPFTVTKCWTWLMNVASWKYVPVNVNVNCSVGKPVLPAPAERPVDVVADDGDALVDELAAVCRPRKSMRAPFAALWSG